MNHIPAQSAPQEFENEPAIETDGEALGAAAPLKEPYGAPKESMTPEIDPSLWRRLEIRLDRASEWFNPILVKEARQAMKSRQFAVTFGLLLICGWGWTMLGSALFSPAIYYSSMGYAMLVGYYIILAFPLTVIVPFAAYRSLAAEREDGTYELLSITTLKARQIIGGKLGSSMLQMLVYFSALAPCMAFTYLLRGVDIVTIGLVLFYTLLGSIGLSSASLLLATVSRTRHWQIMWMVLLILGLFGVFWMAAYGVSMMIFEAGNVPYDEPIFWIAQAMFLTVYGTYLALVLLAATARIGFASENRSTRLRIAMLVQQALYIAWMAWFWWIAPQDELFFVYFMFAGAHWAVLSALLVGESPEVSQRVRRGLPQSFLGRMFLTWFNPGPGAGYIFAIANLFIVVALGLAAAWYMNAYGLPNAPDVRPQVTGFLILAYITIYAGMTRLAMIFINRYSRPGPMGSFVVASVFAALGCLIPMIVQYSLIQYMGDDYLPLQATNFVWTLSEAIDARSFLATHGLTVLVIAVAALFVFAVNLFAAAGEVQRVRQAAPARIALDEAVLHPERYVKHVPKNPLADDE